MKLVKDTQSAIPSQKYPFYNGAMDAGADYHNQNSGLATIVLSTVLVALTAAAFANNFLGFMGLLAAPFWLPVCCKYVPPLVTKIYLGLSVIGLLLTLLMAPLSKYLLQHDKFVFVFGLSFSMIAFGSLLGVFVSCSAHGEAMPFLSARSIDEVGRRKKK